MSEAVLDWWEYHEGRRCALAAWHHHRQRAGGERPSFDGDEARDRLRGLAQQQWPGGQDTWTTGPTEADLDERTRRLIASGATAIFRATITAGGTSLVVDVLERTAQGSWCAVLLSTRYGLDRFLVEQAALTLHVLQAASIPVAGVHLVHVDADYRKGKGPIEPEAFLVRRSLTIRAARAKARVVSAMAVLTDIAAEAVPPDVPRGTHCRACTFTDRCVETLPADWTGRYPTEAGTSADVWLARGYERMGDVPADEPMGAPRRRARLASRTGRIVVDPALPQVLEACRPPVWYLDFECVWSLLPVFEGTAPAQHVPFLWSLHHVDEEGRLTHLDEIVAPGPDPRRRMAESLVEAVGAYHEPIVVYGDYEAERIGELAALFPDLAPALERIRGRIVDLLAVIRDHVYDLQFRGNFSLKAVGPVLAPGLTYRELAIRDGLTAARAYARLLYLPEVTPDDVETTLADLRAYCERDTLALVDVHRTLMNLAQGATMTAEGEERYPEVRV